MESNDTPFEPTETPLDETMVEMPAFSPQDTAPTPTNNPHPSPPINNNENNDPDWSSIIVTVFVFAWLTIGTVFSQTIYWFSEETAIALDTPFPAFARPLFSINYLFIMALPVVPLAFLWKAPRYRAVFRAWAVALLYGVFMLPVRFIAPQAAIWLAVWQIAGTLAYIFTITSIIGLRQRQQGKGFIKPRRPYLISLVLLPFFACSWLMWGALGSGFESLMQLGASLLFGLAAGILIGHYLIRHLQEHTTTVGWDMLFGGIVAGTTLLLLGTSFGVSGMVILFMVALPASGWVLMGMAHVGAERDERSWFSLTLFVGLLVAGIYLFIDTDELGLILNLGSRDALAWALYASIATLIVGWGLGAGMIALRRDLPRWDNRRRFGIVASVLWFILLAIYLGIGQPGKHGERIFVILNDQANTANATAIADPDMRRQFVYDQLVAHADTSQADIRGVLDRFGIEYKSYYLVNALEVEVGPLMRWYLGTQGEVDRILDSPVLRPLPALPSTTTGGAIAPTSPQWNLTLIGADRAWNVFGATGEGIVIGQSDSGAEWTHSELMDSYRGGEDDHDYNWFDPWYGTAEPNDIGGHGTHTLGSVLGNNVGVAPDATWFGCANLMRNLANPALYLDCMQFMLAPFPLDGDPLRDGDPTRGAHVLNNSWGCPPVEGCDTESLFYGVRNLRNAGIFVVASAGNSGPSCESVNTPLPIYDDAFAVGAVDEGSRITDFSSRGPVTVDGSGRIKPDILAPGADVLSAFPNNSYEYASGTSMAGPHVAGVVALLWSANPDLIGDIDRTEQILIETTTSYRLGTAGCGDGANGQNNDGGYGLINAFSAVERAVSE